MTTTAQPTPHPRAARGRGDRISDAIRQRMSAFPVLRYPQYVDALPRTPSAGKVELRALVDLGVAGERTRA